jgi:hypothetical protein
MKCLPADLSGYSDADLSMLCECGHFVNSHSEGLGAYPSICSEEGCICDDCVYDRDMTIMVNWFEKTEVDRPKVEYFTKFPKAVYMCQYGLPTIFETSPIAVGEKQ